MKEHNKIARPYAKAIYKLAIQKNNEEEWRALLSVYASLLSLPDVVKFFQTFRAQAEKKYALLVDEVPGLFPDFSSFLRLLVSRRRLFLLPTIASLFEQYHLTNQSVLQVSVTSASSWPDASKEKLLKEIASRFSCRVEPIWQVDSTLLGGAVVRIGDYVIDGSVRQNFQRLRELLKK